MPKTRHPARHRSAQIVEGPMRERIALLVYHSVDREEDPSDDEPSLGWCEGMAQGQGRWGDTADLEMAG